MTTLYLNKLNSRGASEQIILTAQDLLADLDQFATPDIHNISYRLATPADVDVLTRIIQVAYNSRYASQDEQENHSFGEVELGDTQRTALAVCRDPSSGRELILATLRLNREDLELFRFFRHAGPWPHEVRGLTPFEFERLAFHPYYDLCPDAARQRQLVRGLMECLLTGVNRDHSWFGSIMSPNVVRFLDGLGLTIRELPDTQLADTKETRYLRDHWPRYWTEARAYEFVLTHNNRDHRDSQANAADRSSAASPESTADAQSDVHPHTAPEDRNWQRLITHEWDLDWVRDHLEHPATLYSGRPILMSAHEVRAARIFDFSDEHLAVPLLGRTAYCSRDKFYSLVDSTLAKLQENLSETHGPVAGYLHTQIREYEGLADKRDYGFYAFYFTRAGELEAAVQFPPLPVYKLALASSSGQLLQNRDYTSRFLATRLLFAQAHILVAGASVASATAESLIRDGRIGFLTLADPKAPNATNLNRTNYDVIDIGSGERKAVSLARRLHRQDPTQIIYLVPEGITRANCLDYLSGSRDIPPADLVVEAIDSLPDKLAIWELARSARVPVVQLADVGSIASITCQNARARDRGESLVFGLSDEQLHNLLARDFLQVAARIVGLDNAARDEMGRWVTGDKNTPFGVAMPQLGSTASVAAGVASELILRYLLDRHRQPDFPYRRVIIDKKHPRAHGYRFPSLRERVLALLLSLRPQPARA